MTDAQSNVGTDQLPTDCPQCGRRLETREDVMVEMFAHVGDSQ